MEADWEVEVGGGAPVIDALWPGFVDLRLHPERIGEIQEAVDFPPLAGLLRTLNGASSLLWTAKCGLWEPGAAELTGAAIEGGVTQVALACYVDMLPLEGRVFVHWQQAETFCRQWVASLVTVNLPDCRVDLVVRLAVAGGLEGFGITAYLGAAGPSRSAASETLRTVLALFADAIPSVVPPATSASKLQ